MQRKPWPILLLAFSQFLSPLTDILAGSQLMHLSALGYLAFLFRSNGWLELIQYFGIAPLAGFAIFMVRRWSYPVFLGCFAWIALSNFDTWQHNPKAVSLDILVGCYSFNIFLVTYFLLKQVRITYYNPRVRWWESKPRYTLNTFAHLKIHDHKMGCTLINISEGGAFIQTNVELKPRTPVQLTYTCFGKEFTFAAEVLYQVLQQKYSYGIQFIIPFKKRTQIKNLIKVLEILEIERRPERTPWYSSLGTWLKGIFLEGKGMVPQIPMAVYMEPVVSHPLKRKTAARGKSRKSAA